MYTNKDILNGTWDARILYLFYLLDACHLQSTLNISNIIIEWYVCLSVCVSTVRSFISVNIYKIEFRLFVHPSKCPYVRVSPSLPIHPSTKGLVERIVKSRKGQERADSERKVLERGRKASSSITCISFLCMSPCLDMMNLILVI